jgi:hypothetical protein
LHPHGIAVGCKIAKRGGVMNETRTSRSQRNWYVSCNFANVFELCKSHGKAHNLLETLHLSKLMANLITFYFRNSWTMAFLLMHPVHTSHIPNGNGIFVRVAGVVSVVSIMSLQSHSTLKFQIQSIDNGALFR